MPVADIVVVLRILVQDRPVARPYRTRVGDARLRLASYEFDKGRHAIRDDIDAAAEGSKTLAHHRDFLRHHPCPLGEVSDAAGKGRGATGQLVVELCCGVPNGVNANGEAGFLGSYDGLE